MTELMLEQQVFSKIVTIKSWALLVEAQKMKSENRDFPEPIISEYEPRGANIIWPDQGIYVVIEETGGWIVSEVIKSDLSKSRAHQWDTSEENDTPIAFIIECIRKQL